MENVKIAVKGNILTITVDLSAETTPSSTGKTLSIASTRGNVKVPDTDAFIGLNVYRYPPRAK